MRRPVLLLVLGLFLAACERPFVEAVAPTLEMLEPMSLDTVRTEPRLPLAFRAASFRAVNRVEVNGEDATYLREHDVYLDTLQLQVGLNVIRVDAFDVEGTVGTDTLYAVYLPSAFADVAERLPYRLGGHAATPLRDGTVLLTGGAVSIGAPALEAALRFDPRTFTFTPEPASLNEARVSHTASRLPDGRVLILGGSRRLVPESPSDLVTIAEIYDPASRTFTPVPLVNTDGEFATDPIQRTEHTTTLLENADGQTFVYLYGGLGPRFDGEAVLPIEFMRTLRLETEPDRLVAVGIRERFRFAPISGHTQTPLADVGTQGFGRYLVAGSSLSGGTDLRAPFVFDFGPNFVDAANAGPLMQPRTDHAAAPLGDLVLVAGGRTPETQVLETGEVFALDPAQFFAFPASLQPRIARWGHTATNLGDGRILLVGGFSASGESLDRIELFLPR